MLSVALGACTSDSPATLHDGGSGIRRRDAGALAVAVDASSALPPDADPSGERGDASMDAGVAVPAQATASDCTGEPPIMKVRDDVSGLDVDPDWSCYNTRDAGADAGTLAELDPRLMADASTRRVAFSVATLLPSFYEGITADFFFGPSTLGAPALTRVFEPDAGATVQIDVPSGADSVSVRIHALPHDNPSNSIIEIREYDFPIPRSDTPIQGYALIHDMIRLGLNLALAGGTEDPAKAIIMADARDCLGRTVSGAQFELIDGDTKVPVQVGSAPGLPHVSYSRFALPGTMCTFTTDSPATWMLIDAPVNVSGESKTHAYRLRLLGRQHASDSKPVVIGERELELFPGVLTLVRPYRETPR
jgi:hypothetical protein